jgi:hypothetical protein
MSIVCIVAALLAMQHYIKRAVEGKLREHADSIGGQYDAKHIDSSVTSTQTGTTTMRSVQVRQASGQAEDGSVDGVQTTITESQTSGRTGYENLQAFPGGLFD